ncbi:MAG TPA: ATP-dependent 6-phosphofructokinase [Polyangiaceae bacterium]|nr:ATP-dependent 6-phosphofructokinase [Polyangiaceae bacterium]
MKRLAVLTSGGDAPGMNAAIRAVVRSAEHHGLEAIGVRQGYLGLVRGEFMPLGSRAVSGIIQKGGTILGTARAPEFEAPGEQSAAVERLRGVGIDGLVVIGGNGSQAGALALSRHGFPVVGISSTIDNDLEGCDVSLGVDTALNVALEAIDRLKVTAASHGRVFLVEVMGRNCGYLALAAGIAGGAEAVIVPESEAPPELLAAQVRRAYDVGKAHALVVVAEGARSASDALSRYFIEHRDALGFDLRVTKLGHVQRGGAPGAFDRLLGSRLGIAAVEHLLRGEHGLLVGLCGSDVRGTPLEHVAGHKKVIPQHLFEIAHCLSR